MNKPNPQWDCKSPKAIGQSSGFNDNPCHSFGHWSELKFKERTLRGILYKVSYAEQVCRFCGVVRERIYE